MPDYDQSMEIIKIIAWTHIRYVQAHGGGFKHLENKSLWKGSAAVAEASKFSSGGSIVRKGPGGPGGTIKICTNKF